MKYMLITVVNRDIVTEEFDTQIEAQKKMEEEYNEATADEDRFEDGEINEDSAWANVDDNDFQYDWAIVAV